MRLESCDWAKCGKLFVSARTRSLQLASLVRARYKHDFDSKMTRIEFAAAFLASACSHGYTSGEETDEGLVGQRYLPWQNSSWRGGRERIYAQDSDWCSGLKPPAYVRS